MLGIVGSAVFGAEMGEVVPVEVVGIDNGGLDMGWEEVGMGVKLMEVFGSTGCVSGVKPVIDDMRANSILFEGDKVMGFARVWVHLDLLGA